MNLNVLKKRLASFLFFAILSVFCFAKPVLILQENIEEREIFLATDDIKRKSYVSWSELNDDIEYLFYYPSKGKDVYRLGLVNKQQEEQHTFSFDNKDVVLSLYDDKYIPCSSSPRYREIKTEDSVYIGLSSFAPMQENSIFKKGSDIVLQKFANIAKNYQDKKNIIIDLRSNGGGLSDIGMYPFYEMTKKKPWLCQKS